MANLLIVPNSVSAGTNGRSGQIVVTGVAMDDEVFYQIGFDAGVYATDTSADINQKIIDAVVVQCGLLGITIDEFSSIRVFGALT